MPRLTRRALCVVQCCGTAVDVSCKLMSLGATLHIADAMVPSRGTKPFHALWRSARIRVARSRTAWYVAVGTGVVLLLAFIELWVWGIRRRPSVQQPQLVFVFSTGRCGTLHLARSLEAPGAYVTHEEEHARLRTRDVVARTYRGLASMRDEAAFNASADAYVRGAKAVYWNHLLERHNATRLVYTGHLAGVFGLAPSIWRAHRGRVRFVRLRRGRIATALSLMALGPEDEDPWSVRPRRWFPTPAAPFARLRVEPAAWERFNRFQRWLWFVDDVECRWQALRREVDADALWEVSLEELAVMDGGAKWRELAAFMGVNVGKTKSTRHNSIQSKKRVKQTFDEAVLREWDEDYRKLVGPCMLDDRTSYRWE